MGAQAIIHTPAARRHGRSPASADAIQSRQNGDAERNARTSSLAE